MTTLKPDYYARYANRVPDEYIASDGYIYWELIDVICDGNPWPKTCTARLYPANACLDGSLPPDARSSWPSTIGHWIEAQQAAFARDTRPVSTPLVVDEHKQPLTPGSCAA